MLAAANNPLVSGESANPATPTDIEAIRRFYYQGRLVELGEVLSVPRAFAMEMSHAKKAVLHTAPVVVDPVAPEVPAETEPAPAPAAEKTGKGKK